MGREAVEGVPGLVPARRGADIGLLVSDIGRSLDCYHGLLGLELLAESDLPFGRLYRLGFGDSVIKLVTPKQVPPAGPEGLAEALGLRYLTFPIVNFDDMCERVAAHGIAWTMVPQELLPGVHAAMFLDPDGNTIEFVHRPN